MKFKVICFFVALLTYGSALGERTGRIEVLLPNGVSRLVESKGGKQPYDTLRPLWQGPFTFLHGPYRIEYEATKLTPTGACSVVAIAHGVASVGSAASKQCSVLIWNDASGTPGTKLYGALETADAPIAGSIELNWYTVNPPVGVSGPFWVGNYELDTLFPTTALDVTKDLSNKWSVNGSSWSDENADYFHAAAVKYGQVGTPEINVVPNFLSLFIESSKSSKIAQETYSFPPSPEDDEYWEDIAPGELIIAYNDEVNVHKATLKELGIANKGVTVLRKGLEPLNFIVVNVPGGLSEMKEFMKLMEGNPQVKYVEPNRIMHLLFTPNDPGWSQQWGPQCLNAPAAWDLQKGSMDITVGIVDNGVDYTHPDLSAHFTSTKGYDFYGGDSDPMPGSDPNYDWHGTHCAGIAAAVINNDVGIAGIANIHLYALKVGQGSGTTSDYVVSAIQWCITNNVDVISISLGASNHSPSLENACNDAWASGCVLAAATGNQGTTPISYPARYSSTIAVGALQSCSQIWGDSNYGPNVDLAAPGYGILSCGLSHNYVTADGTSMACPHVSGSCALLLSQSPGATNQQVKDALTSTAVDLGTAGKDNYYGYGRPDLYAALNAIDIIPLDTGMVTVYNQSSATGDLYVSDMTWNKTWVISVSPKSFTVTPGSSRDVNIVVGGKLGAGVYYDTLWIASNDPDDNPFPVVLKLRVGVGVEEETAAFQTLLNAYPNPATKSTTVNYTISSPTTVSLALYDITGRVAKTLVHRKHESGHYSLDIDTQGLTSGIYFIVLSAGDTLLSQKILLMQ